MIITRNDEVKIKFEREDISEIIEYIYRGKGMWKGMIGEILSEEILLLDLSVDESEIFGNLKKNIKKISTGKRLKRREVRAAFHKALKELLEAEEKKLPFMIKWWKKRFICFREERLKELAKEYDIDIT